MWCSLSSVVREPCIIGIGFRRDSSLSTSTALGGQVCAIVDSVSHYDGQPSTYRNVDWALFGLVNRFWKNLNTAKEVRNEENA